MQLGKKTMVIICVFFVLGMISTVQAAKKSVYAVTNHSYSTIGAFEIVNNEIEYQTETNLDFGSGAVGLAIDPDSWTIFTSYDGSYNIGIINAKTMEPEEDPVLVASWELVGIVWDNTIDRLYGMRREGSTSLDNIVIYKWDPLSKELTQDGDTIKLPNFPNNGMGITLDEDEGLLYATDNTNTVYVYNTSDWSFVDSFDVTVDTNDRKCVAIAVYNDGDGNSWVYTGGYSHTSGDHDYLVKTSTESPYTSSEVDVEDNVSGVTVDAETGLIYITSFHQDIRVYDSNLILQYSDGNNVDGNPADICLAGDVSYKPPVFDLVKDDNDVDCAYPWNEIDENYLVYSICYDANGFADTNVIITDHLPDDVNYFSSEPCGDYNSTWHTVTWDINDISGADSNCLQVTVKVKHTVKPGRKIINLCEMEGDLYYKSTTKETTICCYGGDIIYVDKDANGFNNGTSWLDAYEDLQDAFLEADNCGCEQIQVAEGTYKPTDINDTSARLISFELLDDVAIYGGFPSGGGQWVDRDPNAYETILSGDIATQDNQYDNSYHVIKCQDVNNAILDGFTITAGNANGSGDNAYGGGIYCKDSNSITVRNCVISQNEAHSGIGYGGGGIYFEDSTNLTLTDCNISDNTAYGGGALYNKSSETNINNCIFSGNSAMAGGGMYNRYEPSPTVVNCTFNDNTVHWYDDTYGGGICNDQSSPTLINCTFNGNSATTTGTGEYSYGGAICNWDDSDPNISNCIFSNNSADDGGAVCNYDSDPNITNCIFTGNTAVYYGGGILNWNYSDANVTNCIFSGNSAGYGGGVENWQSYPTVTNCTFSGNSAGFGGGMHNGENSVPNITNCILWDNEATVEDEIYNDVNSNPNISYSDIEDSNGSGNKWGRKLGADHGGNIDEDPCFFDVEEPNGSWTEDASYDSSKFQSTLTDTYAYWSVNQLAGKFVNPDTLNQDLHFFIVSNDVNTIKVWSDVESIASNGDTYQIYDYHLKLDSACIDAGDPNGDYTGQTDIDGEPRVFDGDYNDTEIVDMGADEYYWSPADFNSDGLVNFFDYALFADAWQSEPNDVNYYDDVYDLVDNNYIDSKDLARFCEDWLWQTAWAKTFPFAYDQTMGRGMGKYMSESLSLTGDIFPSAPAEKARPELTAADMEEIIKWLAELWLTDDEVRKMISADEWLKFMEAVIQALKEQIYN